MQPIELDHKQVEYRVQRFVVLSIPETGFWRVIMEAYRAEELRLELNDLLQKQREVLESRMLGSVSDDDLLEYEIRQEVIHELCNVLSHSAAA